MTAVRLKEILDSVRKQSDLAPHDGITYCNIALDRILGLYGQPRMMDSKGNPIMANAMCDFMRDHPESWTKVDGNTACARASQGILVVACQKENEHGHVAAVYPSPMETSGSWQKEVPMLNNVGKDVGVMRCSKCFRTEPDYYSVKVI